METIEPPQYLYKILSYRQWLVTEKAEEVAVASNDDLFIHLSKKDQVDKTLVKYFIGEDRAVVLKLDTKKLQGRLVYERNPGGEASYYHLYEGSIPCRAIKEANLMYLKPREKAIDVLELGDPMLSQVAKELTEEEIMSSETQELIQKMIHTMKKHAGVGIAAPQIGYPLQVLVIEDMDHSHLTREQILEREREKIPLQVLVNPKLFVEGEESREFFEGCLSIPGFVGLVPRAYAVRVEARNERGEPVVIHAKGWYARILQHEIDHLQGILYTDRAALLMTERFGKTKTLKR
ncbi:MAG: peptide deformylase [Chlamydiae bacterium]|nr:peptide deformylase [Chlamydiota bacterium]